MAGIEDGAATAGAEIGEADGWAAGLGEDDARLVESKGWSGWGDVIEGYRQLERLQGVPTDQLLRLPGEDAGDADWSEVHRRLGCPEDAEGYRFPDRDDADPAVDRMLAEEAHALGLTPRQAEALRDRHYEGGAQADERHEGAIRRGIANVERSFSEEYGAAAETELGYADSGIRFLGGQDVPDLRAVLDSAGLTGNVGLMKRLALLGHETSEDGALPGGGFGASGGGGAADEIAQLRADKDFMKAFMNSKHTGHKDAVARMETLQAEARRQAGGGEASDGGQNSA